MKLLSRLFLIFYFSILCISVFAGASNCTIDPVSMQNATEFLARCGDGLPGVSPGDPGDGKAELRDRIILIANGAISLGALLAVGAIVWSGIQYTKAFGDDEKIKKAKMTGIYALIGLILLLISFGIVDIFINFIYTVTGN